MFIQQLTSAVQRVTKCLSHTRVDNSRESTRQFLLGSLANVSKLPTEERQEWKRQSIIRNYSEEFSEPVLLKLLAEIDLDEALSNDIKRHAKCCLDGLVTSKTNEELQYLVSDFANHPFARKLGVIKLIERKDYSAIPVFIYLVAIKNQDVSVRGMAAIGLGEIGNDKAKEILETIPEADRIYEDAKEAIGKICERIASVDI